MSTGTGIRFETEIRLGVWNSSWISGLGWNQDWNWALGQD